MKLLVVFLGFVALCASSAIPEIHGIPGDNSHYVEGVSRYIWMPDGNDIPRLVDLHATVPEDRELTNRRGANNQYWLYTRNNPTSPQIITLGDVQSIWASNYDGRKPLKVLVHGWNSNGNSGMNPTITSAVLEVMDANVIVVDWRGLANGLYTIAVNGVPSVGEYLGHFTEWLIDTAGGDWQQTHFIGFSLGAHVVGNAGRTVGGKVARITGLDPAGPIWGGNDRALNADDGIYVEAIHTDGGLLGIFDPIGAANFYPNGGRNQQPGCWISTCSHSRAYELFAASVVYDHFVANECANLTEARNNRCSGAIHNMGNGNLEKRGSGLYGLTTGRSWPF